MTQAEIATMIAGVGLPYAYDHFKADESPGGPPFICFMYTDDDDFLADDTNYQRITGLTVEQPAAVEEVAAPAAPAEEAAEKPKRTRKTAAKKAEEGEEKPKRTRKTAVKKAEDGAEPVKKTRKTAKKKETPEENA